MSAEVANQINKAAAAKKAAAAQAAAEQQAKAKAPPLSVVNIRNLKAIGTFMFPPTKDDDGFELTPGDNLIDVAKLTPSVQDQLSDWVNAGWIQVLAVGKAVSQ